MTYGLETMTVTIKSSFLGISLRGHITNDRIHKLSKVVDVIKRISSFK